MAAERRADVARGVLNGEWITGVGCGWVFTRSSRLSRRYRHDTGSRVRPESFRFTHARHGDEAKAREGSEPASQREKRGLVCAVGQYRHITRGIAAASVECRVPCEHV
jgi:hypothetical protein